MTQAAAHKILKMKPLKSVYKIPVVQRLQAEDYHATSDFCQQTRQKINQSHVFLEQLTFLMTQLSTSLAKSTTAFGKAEPSIILTA